MLKKEPRNKSKNSAGLNKKEVAKLIKKTNKSTRGMPGGNKSASDLFAKKDKDEIEGDIKKILIDDCFAVGFIYGCEVGDPQGLHAIHYDYLLVDNHNNEQVHVYRQGDRASFLKEHPYAKINLIDEVCSFKLKGFRRRVPHSVTNERLGWLMLSGEAKPSIQVILTKRDNEFIKDIFQEIGSALFNSFVSGYVQGTLSKIKSIVEYMKVIELVLKDTVEIVNTIDIELPGNVSIDLKERIDELDLVSKYEIVNLYVNQRKVNR